MKITARKNVNIYIQFMLKYENFALNLNDNSYACVWYLYSVLYSVSYTIIKLMYFSYASCTILWNVSKKEKPNKVFSRSWQYLLKSECLNV